uniref:Uncharacterized protein n=1 Tax=Triticum urartu TaxID=4572 RepID=A0A8R7UL64_TRIUA
MEGEKYSTGTTYFKFCMWAQAWQRQRPPTLLGSTAADLPCPRSSRAVSLLPLTVDFTLGWEQPASFEFPFLFRLCSVNGLYPEESRLHCY